MKDLFYFYRKAKLKQSGRRCICSAGAAYAAPSIFLGRCICSAQRNFIKTLILFLKIEILELKFRKNTVFFVKKKYNFWLSYFFSKMKLKKRFFCNSVANLIFLGASSAAYAAPKKYAWRYICIACQNLQQTQQILLNLLICCRLWQVYKLNVLSS